MPTVFLRVTQRNAKDGYSGWPAMVSLDVIAALLPGRPKTTGATLPPDHPGAPRFGTTLLLTTGDRIEVEESLDVLRERLAGFLRAVHGE